MVTLVVPTLEFIVVDAKKPVWSFLSSILKGGLDPVTTQIEIFMLKSCWETMFVAVAFRYFVVQRLAWPWSSQEAAEALLLSKKMEAKRKKKIKYFLSMFLFIKLI
jgi:hypothetical protein